MHLQDFIYACQQGDVDVVKALWRPHWLHELNKLKREDTCHPLLTAVHHLRPAVVEFLCDQVRERLCAPLELALVSLCSCAPGLIPPRFLRMCRDCHRFAWALCTPTPATAWW